MSWRRVVALAFALLGAVGAEDYHIIPARVVAVITDAAGKPVPDLKQEEFLVRLGGAAQMLTSAAPLPPAPRAIVFVVDDTGMTAAELAAVRQALAAAAAADRLVAVTSIRGGSGAHRQLTRDRAVTAAALAELTWRPPLSPPLREAALLDALTRAAIELRPVEGAKSVVVIAAGPFAAGEAWRRRVQAAAEEALRSSVVCDWVGLRPAPAPPAPSSSAPFRWEDSVSLMLPAERAMRREIQDCTGDLGAYLAAQTGGRLLAGLAELPSTLEDAAGAYRLEWTPGGRVREDRRRLEVAVTRPGARVRIVGDFVEPKKPEIPPRRQPPRERVQRAMFSLMSGADIPVWLTAVAAPEDAVSLLLHIGPRGVELREEAGCAVARLETLAALETFDNTETPIESRVSELRICGENLEAVRRRGVALTLDAKAPPGLYQARVAVRNVPPEGGSAMDGGPRLIPRSEAESISIGAASQALEIPDAKKRAPVVAGLIAAAGPGAAGYRIAADGDAAVRRFRPGQRVSYRFHVLGAAEARVRVLRDGVEIAAAPAVVAENVAAGEFRLAPSVEPGAYVLEAAAGAASQWIGFEIVR